VSCLGVLRRDSEGRGEGRHGPPAAPRCLARQPALAVPGTAATRASSRPPAPRPASSPRDSLGACARSRLPCACGSRPAWRDRNADCREAASGGNPVFRPRGEPNMRGEAVVAIHDRPDQLVAGRAYAVTGSWSHSFKTYANVQLSPVVRWLGLAPARDLISPASARCRAVWPLPREGRTAPSVEGG